VETPVSSIFWTLAPWNNMLLLKHRRIEILDQKLCMDGMNCLNKNSLTANHYY